MHGCRSSEAEVGKPATPRNGAWFLMCMRPFPNSSGDDWIFETKLDGYRAIAVIDSTGKARLWSRNRLPLEPKSPTVRDTVNELKLRSTILDGEIVASDNEPVYRP